jgi:hypothetical protein
MSLFRCSVPKRRNSSKFLSLEETHAVGEVLEKTVWLDHFDRTGGITSEGETRFGPRGFPKWPLYSSEKHDTTYFEFSYWKLKEWQSEIGKPTKACLIVFDFNPQAKPLDVQTEPDFLKIIDIANYGNAHKWITALGSIPESISYPSVRDINPGGLNFAIYNGDTVSNVAMREEVTMTVLNKDEVEVIFSNKTKLNYKPIK